MFQTELMFCEFVISTIDVAQNILNYYTVIVLGATSECNVGKEINVCSIDSYRCPC